MTDSPDPDQPFDTVEVAGRAQVRFHGAPITVADLIAALRCMPADAFVYITVDGSACCPALIQELAQGVVELA